MKHNKQTTPPSTSHHFNISTSRPINPPFLGAKPPSTNKQGLTLIELLISGLVASFLLMGVLALITSFLKSRATVNYSYNLQTVSESIFNHLATEIQDSDSAEITGLSRLTLTQDQTQINYFTDANNRLISQLSSGETKPITPENVKVLTFSVFDLSPQTDSELTAPALIQIQLELQNFTKGVPRNTLETKTSISVRPNKVKNTDQ